MKNAFCRLACCSFKFELDLQAKRGQKGTLHLCLIPTVSDLVNQDSQERNREDSDETWRVAVSEYCLTSVIGTPIAYLQTVVVL